MSDNNKEKIMDEKLEDVTGGKGFGKSSTAFIREREREMERQKKVEQLAKEAVGRMDPNDPTSWFQTVTEVFDENAGKQ